MLQRFAFLRAFAVACAALASAAPARAASTVHLDYRAPAGCPAEAEFVRAVAERGGSFERPTEGVGYEALVSIEKEGVGFAGSLQMRTGQGPSAAREVHGKTCSDVAEGLAVITSIALRERAEDQASATAPPTATDEPALVARPGPPPITPTPPGPQSKPKLDAEPAQDTRLRVLGQLGLDEAPVTAGQLKVTPAIPVTLTGGAVFGAIPGLILPRYDLTISRANILTTPSSDRYLLAGLLRVRWTFLGPATYRTADSQTAISGFKTGLGFCAPLTFDAEGLVLLGCSDFTVGVMYLTTDLVGTPRQYKSIGQGSAGLELDSMYNIGSRFHLALNLGAEAWMSKLSVARPDGSELFHSRVLNAHADFGFGITF